MEFSFWCVFVFQIDVADGSMVILCAGSLEQMLPRLGIGCAALIALPESYFCCIFSSPKPPSVGVFYG